MRRLATQGPVSYRIAAALQWAEVYVRVGSFNNTMVQNESLNNTMVQLELIRQLAEFNDGMSRVIGKAWNRKVGSTAGSTAMGAVDTPVMAKAYPHHLT